MKKIILTISLLLSVCVYAQSERAELQILQAQYRAFEYDKVITLADSLLSDASPFDTTTLVMIYDLKAVSHFSINELDKAFAAFIEILELQPDYQPDAKWHSPKIIDFFNSIQKTKAEKKIVTETVTQIDTVFLHSEQPNYKRILPLSLVLPGTGHLALGKKTKGRILTTASAITLGGMIVSIADCRRKQDAYMAAVRIDDIEKKYADYNSAYRTRNALITAYSLLWLYSQADLLFFELPHTETSIAFVPQVLRSSVPALMCSIQF